MHPHTRTHAHTHTHTPVPPGGRVCHGSQHASGGRLSAAPADPQWLSAAPIRPGQPNYEGIAICSRSWHTEEGLRTEMSTVMIIVCK